MCSCIAPPSRDWCWKLFVGTTSGQIAVRCGGRSSAIRTWVIAGERGADRADAAGRPALLGDPLDRVVAVLALVRRRGVEVLARALGAVAVAAVLEADGVAVRDEEVGDLDVALVGLVVRRAAEDRRIAPLDELAVARGPVDVGREPDPVPHRHHHVLRQRHSESGHASPLSISRLPASSTSAT